MLRKLKRGLSVFIAATVLLGCFSMSFGADEVPQPPSTQASITVETLTAIQDDTVNVTVSIANNPGFSTYNLNVNYDKSVLTPVDITTALTGQFNKNLDATSDQKMVSASFTSSNTEANITDNGTLFTISFKVAPNAAVGDSTLSLSGTLANLDSKAILFTAVAGKISVAAKEFDVTVETDGNGAASTKNPKYKADDTVTITASPNANYSFKSWMSSDGITFANAKAAETTFVMPAKAVTVLATFQDQTVSDRVVTVVCEPIDVGTVTTNKEKYTTGAVVLLDATPKQEYAFKEWKTSDGVTFSDKTTPASTFVMPGKDVTVTAVFEPLTLYKYSFTAHTDGNGTVQTSQNYYSAGSLVELSATPAPNYVFKEWRSENRVHFADKTSSITSLAMPDENVNVTAVFEYNPGARFGVTIYTEGGGTAYSDKREYTVGERVILTATPRLGYLFYGWTSTSNITFLNPSSMNTSFIMPARKVTIRAMFVANSIIGGGGGGSVGGGGSATNPPPLASIYTVNFDTQGGTYVPSATVYNGGIVSKPTDPTRAGYIFGGWYTEVSCTNTYNFNTGIKNSFTLYARWISEAENELFSDISKSDWFYNYVLYLSQKDIIDGVGNNKFKPNSNITRAQFAQILAKLSGSKLEGNSTTFKDVQTTNWFYGAVAWASKNGIVKGTDSSEFLPNAPITRQDMAVMISRYIKNVIKKDLPAVNELKAFADGNSISQYAKESVYDMQKYGIIGGKPNNRFDPKANATRAEACKMVYSLIKAANIKK